MENMMNRQTSCVLIVFAFASLLAASATAQSKAPQTKLPPQTKVNIPRPATGFQNWGFELGTLEGWTKSGTAFDSQPTFENNVAARRPDVEVGHEGNYWVGTFENRRNASAPFGGTQGDEKTGRLISPDFTVEKRYISFLIGGGRGSGRNETLMVRLLGVGADGRTAQVKVATGWDEEEMQREVWDVYALRGKKARIEIVDEATGPWGHINVDDFQFSDVAPVNARATDNPGIPAVRKGKFRVTVNGFIAHQQTWDDALQRDGKDDEVFLAGETRILTNATGIPDIATLPQVRSMVMGDIQGFDDRLRAGSASDLGGIRSGDPVPVAKPWTRQRTPGRQGLPFILWEGELIADRVSALIVPTIWEWDQGEGPFDGLVRSILDSFGTGNTYGGEAGAPPSGNRLLRRASERQIGTNVLGTETTFARSSVTGEAGSRPIGMSLRNGRFALDPWVLALTYDDAVATSRTDAGRGKGVIEVVYEDATELRGRYTLFVQIEQLP
jgi:hypothetical protein